MPLPVARQASVNRWDPMSPIMSPPQAQPEAAPVKDEPATAEEDVPDGEATAELTSEAPEVSLPPPPSLLPTPPSALGDEEVDARDLHELADAQ